MSQPQIYPDYLKKLLLLFQSFFSGPVLTREKPFYRIIALPNENDKNIHFQIIGKNIQLKMLPEQIMRDNLLLMFSKTDIILITNLGTKNESIAEQINKPKNKLFKILKQIFYKDKTFFLVQKASGDVSKYEAHEIYSDKALAKKFPAKDAMKIGYTAAQEHYQKIQNLKNKN